jgi:hypothetical protein
VAKRAYEDWCNESTVTGQLQSLLCQKMGLTLFCTLCAFIVHESAADAPISEVSPGPHALSHLKS